MKPFLKLGHAKELAYPDHSFDLVVSLGALHNLYVYDLKSALQEIQRVGKEKKYVAVESYRNEREMANLLYWQLTCESFYNPEEWEWIYQDNGYSGDFGFIFFE